MEQNVLVRDGFEEGMLIEVLSDRSMPVFVGRIKALEGGSVTLVDAESAPLPPAEAGAMVRLRGRPPRALMALYTGRLCVGSRIFWKIDQLEGGPIQNRREFYRQPVSAEGIVILLDGPGGEAAGAPSACRVLDISGGGMRLSCDETFAVGDHLLAAEIALLENQEPFSFGCEVRRVEEGGRSNVYGCQFEGLREREQNRLINAINFLQRKYMKR